MKTGTFREFQLYMVWFKLALGVTPLLERQPGRRHLIFGPATGKFGDDHHFKVRLRLIM